MSSKLLDNLFTFKAIYHRTLYFNDYLLTWLPFAPICFLPSLDI